MNTVETTERLLSAGYNDWEREFKAMTVDQCDELVDHLIPLAVLTAMLSEYAFYRYGGLAHDRAIAKAKTMEKRIRKALGYSYP